MTSSIQVERAENGAARLVLRGSVDVSCARQLHAEATALGTQVSVVVDCVELERLDVTAVQVLLAWSTGLIEQGAELEFVDVPKPVVGALRSVGLDELLSTSRRSER